MKLFKRIAALAMSAIMAVGMMTPAFATEKLSSGHKINRGESDAGEPFEVPTEGCSITMLDVAGNKLGGNGYYAYKLFDYHRLTEEEAQGTELNYIYTINASSPWYGFFAEGAGKDYVRLVSFPWTSEESEEPEEPEEPSVYEVQKTEGFNDNTAAAMAKAAMAYARENTQISGGTILGQAGQSMVDPGESAGGGPVSLSSQYTWRLSINQQNTYGSYKSQTGYVAQVTELDQGYYLVGSSMGSLCEVNEMNPHQVIYDKTINTTMKKEIWEPDRVPSNGDYFEDTNWVHAKDSQVGDELYYRITITPGNANENLTLKDLMGRMKIDYANDMKVYKNSDGEQTLLVKNVDYSLYTKDPIDYGTGEAAATKRAIYNRYDHSLPMFYSFGLAFSNALCESMGAGDTIVITYKAKLDDDSYRASNQDAAGNSVNEGGTVTRTMIQDNTAMLGSSGLPRDSFENKIRNDTENAEWPRFGNGDQVDIDTRMPETGDNEITFFDKSGNPVSPSGWNPIATSSAVVFHCGFDLVKIDGAQKVIGGAKFSLYRTNPDTDPNAEPIALTVIENMHGWVEGSKYGPMGAAYRPALGEESRDTTQIIVGFATIVGLDSGDYWVKEIDAPLGYTKMAKPQKITLVSGAGVLNSGAGLDESENIEDAESGIRDTDVADEMTQYTKSGEGLSSGYKINRAGDDAAGLAISESLRIHASGLSQAYTNLCPMVIEGKAGYDLTRYGYPANCTTSMAFCHRVEGDNENWYYGSDGTVVLQVGAEGGQTLGGGENNEVVYGGLAVTNLTGIELPATGGIGTTIFYVVGALLVVGAGVLLVVKKRMNNGSDSE